MHQLGNDPAIAAIGLGSNLGDSRAILAAAVSALNATAGIQVLARSHWYRTQPIGPPQPDYLNGCALLQTTHSPLSLLDILLTVESQFGRVRTERWGARSLDLDLLLYADQILSTPTLDLPHPRLRERAFVLVPLAEIAPDSIEPVTGLAIADLASRVNWSGIRQCPN
ncbi:MAG: 2-amino-4-hydroxy-6-hydroxymethyldihydropteridine diphosphokinase [Aphanocapsa sp. GSE-SYN-MK-11-07L]|jgi:2-amino-4-hydroxy-6-hydroxymethyldihydropteridine diphosphokinase|nr:2-amino-4-hydroxy-6-hydroxymethyldihydropteridine diphosphokinase [Aphanocapsa sp. GSE-SYN-MK-11-07L]